MRRILYSTLLIFILAVQASTQSAERQIDSLKRLINTTDEATLVADYYNELTLIYMHIHPYKAIEYGHKALSLGQKKQHQIGYTYENLFLANYYAGTHSDSLLHYAKLVERHYGNSNDDREKLISFWTYGFYYETTKQSDKEIATYINALDFLRKSNDLSLKENEAPLLNNIANVFAKTGKYYDALEYYNQALSIDDKLTKANILFNIADIYSSNLNAVDTSQIILDDAYRLYEEVEDLGGMIDVMIARAVNYDLQNEFELAHKIYNQALNLIQENELKPQLLYLYNSLTEHYFFKKQYALSIQYGKKALIEAERQGSLEELETIYTVLDSSHLAIGDYQKAYQYKNALIRLKDSINNTQLLGKVEELQAKYKIEENEKENQRLKAENTLNKDQVHRSKIGGLVILLILVLTTMIALYFRRLNKKKQNENEVLTQRIVQNDTQLNNANEKIEEINDIQLFKESKLCFFENIYHELRTPLTIVQGAINKIARSENLNSENKKLLQNALTNNGRISELVSKLLDLSKLDVKGLELNERAVMFYPVIRKIITDFDSMIREKELILKLRYQLKTDLQLNLDKEKFTRILSCYLSNAIIYSPKRGSITITLVESENNIQIAVKDSGKKFTSDIIDVIFDNSPHIQRLISDIQNQYLQKTRLELLLCKEYATLFKGKVWVKNDNQVEIGNTFYFEFPKQEIHSQSHDYKEIQPQESKNLLVNNLSNEKNTIMNNHNDATESILVVEDNFDLRNYICELLQDKYIVIAVENGEDALKQLNAQSFDLIISDIMMPMMDGLQLLKYLKSSDVYRHIPVIILTALSDMDNKLKALKMGANDYIKKPFNEIEFHARINNLIMYQRYNPSTKTIENNTKSILDSIGKVYSAQDRVWLSELEEVVIKSTPDFNFTSDSLAEALYLSRSHLHKKFKELTGITVNQYVKEIRLQKARDLLQNGQVSSVKEASFQVGFKHISYFSQVFEKRFGLKPINILNKKALR